MTEKKWTKGPWVAAATSDLMLWVAIGDPDGEIIAQLDSVNPYDAHLIAAAPELYDALDELRVAIMSVLEGKPFRCLDETMIRTDKALAKARGEQ